MNNIPALELNAITKRFHQGARSLTVLEGASLSLFAGEVVGLVGPSGSGKTTLLQIAGLLDVPTEGSVSIAGEKIASANDKILTAHRRDRIGFIYQFHHLLPEFSALENVMMPLLIINTPQKNAEREAAHLLKKLGLGARLNHRPSELSGGEQQRVAIARALVRKPTLILADEPTGNLDPHTAHDVFSLLLQEVSEQKIAALVVTHNLQLASTMHRVVTLEEGKVIEWKKELA